VKLGAIKYSFLSLLLIVTTGCQQGGVRDDYGDGGGTPQQQRQASRSDIYVRLAIAYMQEGQLGMALKKIKRGIELDSTNGEAHNVLAIIYQRLGETSLAEKHFGRASRLQPRNPYIRNAYGSFLCQQQRYDAADEQFRTALENPLYKTPEVALTNAGICAKKSGDMEEAENYFRTALRHRSDYPQALIQMAQLSYDVGEPLSSRGYLQRFHKVAKHTPSSLWLAIQTERVLGDKNAEASYQMLLRGNYPDSDEMKLLRESSTQ
jgi:type IV pilus assembly protein PilF